MILFPRWNPHNFAFITLAVYTHTYISRYLSPEPAHLAGPSAHTRSRLQQSTSLIIESSVTLSLSVANHLNRFFHSFGHRSQCFTHILNVHNVSCLPFPAGFVFLLAYVTNAPRRATIVHYSKGYLCCNNKERFNQRYRSMSFGVDTSSQHHLLCWHALHPGTVTLPSRLARKASDVIRSVTVP